MTPSENNGAVNDSAANDQHDGFPVSRPPSSINQSNAVGHTQDEDTENLDEEGQAIGAIPTISRPGLDNRNTSKITNRTARTTRNHNKTHTDHPREIPRRPTAAHRQRQVTQPSHFGWVDEDYYDENPWYIQDSRKPIFSLGRPLPHVVRRRRRIRRPKRNDTAKDEEMGMGDMEEIVEEDILDSEKDENVDMDMFGRQTSRVHSNQPVRMSTRGSTATRDAQQQQSRTTAAGVAHSRKRNDAGQPVFDYMPGEPESRDTQLHNPVTHTTTGGSNLQRPTPSGTNRGNQQPDFKIDGEPLGQQERPEVEDGVVDPDELRNFWARLRARHPEPLAEFLATGVAVFLGLTATLSVNLSANQQSAYGDYETTCWAWGFAWMFGIYLGGGVSGAHMNPAISVSLSIFRGFPWRQCAVYVAAQFLASLAAGALAFGLFADSIRYVDPDMSELSRSFFSTPRDWVSLPSAFTNQLAGSAIMSMAVLALGDDQNNPPGAGMHALILGLLLTTLKFTLGYNIGSALNPASDFGPRVVAYAAGYRGPNTFESNWWLYGPWLATMLGAVIGCIVYDGFIFNGSESPVNYRMDYAVMEKGRKIRSAFARCRGRE